MFRLVFVSLWTTYTVGEHLTLEGAQRLCVERYGIARPTFRCDADGILKALIEADGEIVVLNLYKENETAHAS